MDNYTFGAILITIAVLIAYLNHRYVRLQATIVVMLASLLVTLLGLLLEGLGLLPSTLLTEVTTKSHFQDLLLKGMLGYLLFAGSLTIDVGTLLAKRTEIAVLALLSTLASALLIGVASYYLLSLLGIHLPILFCLLFGALISPTDPIAVLATFKDLAVSKRLQTTVAGESLFNDGVGIVIFATLSALTFSQVNITFSSVARLFLEQALGGLAFGAALGLFAQFLIKPIKDPKMLILLTLGLVSGGYALALNLDISGPLAMVVMGILVGHSLRNHQAPEIAHTVDMFWEVIDDVLNLLLFLLIGFEMIIIQFDTDILLAMLLAIPLVLFARLITVAIPIKLIGLKNDQEPYTVRLLTWGGLRGGLALALALSLPMNPHNNLIIAMTYSVVAFSVIVQGLTISRLVKRAATRC